jgi:hypothetical protein
MSQLTLTLLSRKSQILSGTFSVKSLEMSAASWKAPQTQYREAIISSFPSMQKNINKIPVLYPGNGSAEFFSVLERCRTATSLLNERICHIWKRWSFHIHCLLSENLSYQFVSWITDQIVLFWYQALFWSKLSNPFLTLFVAELQED